jgi:transposase
MEKKGMLGIDVSKGYADFLLLGSDANVLEEGFQLSDNKEGRQKLKELITGWQVQGLEELYCGVESTGGYENLWYSYLKTAFKESKVYVCRINPRGVKAVGDAALKRTITDAVSAENIATYMISFSKKLDYGTTTIPLDDGFKEGRQHITYIRMLQKQKIQLGNQLEKLLYQYFSEMLVYCRHGSPVWLLSMLVKYPSAAMVVKAGAARISAIKGISAEKALSVVAKARDSMQDVSPQIGHVIMVTAREVLHRETLIKEEKQYLADLYKESEEVILISSMPGVGTDSAVVIALEIGDVNRFESAKKMASFFGVHPTFKQSGDGIWGNHMSKKGRGEIRSVLYMASLSAVRFNPILKQLYARFRTQGMSHYQAAGVVMHKMLRIIFGMLKNKTKFCAETDVQNQQQSKEKQHEKEQKDKTDKKVKKQKKHRFQKATIQAPISMRAEQKIRKQIASQASD